MGLHIPIIFSYNTTNVPLSLCNRKCTDDLLMLSFAVFADVTHTYLYSADDLAQTHGRRVEDVFCFFEYWIELVQVEYVNNDPHPVSLQMDHGRG